MFIHHNNSRYKNKAFSMLEVVIVLGILVTIFRIGVSFYFSIQKQFKYEREIITVKEYIEIAKNKARVNEYEYKESTQKMSQLYGYSVKFSKNTKQNGGKEKNRFKIGLYQDRTGHKAPNEFQLIKEYTSEPNMIINTIIASKIDLTYVDLSDKSIYIYFSNNNEFKSYLIYDENEGTGIVSYIYDAHKLEMIFSYDGYQGKSSIRKKIEFITLYKAPQIQKYPIATHALLKNSSGYIGGPYNMVYIYTNIINGANITINEQTFGASFSFPESTTKAISSGIIQNNKIIKVNIDDVLTNNDNLYYNGSGLISTDLNNEKVIMPAFKIKLNSSPY